MNKWKQQKLGDVADIKLSNVDKKTNPNERTIRLCNYTDVYRNSFINSEKASSFMVASCNDKEYEKFLLKKGQVAITKDSETSDDIGIPTYILEDFHDVVLGYHLSLITPDDNKLDGRFLHYFLCTKQSKTYFENNTGGSGQRYSLSLDCIKSIPLNLPDLSTQQKIAAVLSALDTKIELNARINAELESMAKTVFRYQFVENKEKGNWKIGTLGDVAENIRRSANPSDISPETHYIGLEHMPRKSIALAEYGNASELESNKYAFKTGEFLFGKLRPYFHKVGIAPVDGVCSTDILVISPKSPEWYGFVLGHISSDEIIKYADATSGGTKMPRTNWESLAKFEISMPPVELAKQFTDFFVPIAKQIRTNILESQTLTELRDWLLPMLMNGQVRV